MKDVSIKISDDAVFCFDSTKLTAGYSSVRLCRFVGISSFGCRWWCLLGEPVELFSNTEEEGLKLMKCQRCLDEFWFSQG